MIREIIICDRCNSQPAPNEVKGIFEGPRDAARDAGWAYKTVFTGKWVSVNKQDICPDCEREMEDKEDV